MAALLDTLTNQAIPLHGVLTVIGRDPGCDIVAESPLVSARHLIILNRGGSYNIEDLASMNGTLLNGERVVRRVRLSPGDQISVVGATFVFQSDESTAPQAAANTEAGVETLPEEVGHGTIRMSDLRSAPHVPELSSIGLDGDLRLSVRPEAKLRAVLEIARDLSHSLDLKVVLPQILDSLFAVFPSADCGFIFLRNPVTEELTPAATKARAHHASEGLHVSRGIIRQVLASGRAILSQDVGVDSRIRLTDSIRNLDIRSVMCVPINRDDGDCMGVIQLDSRDRSGQFNDEDLALLVCASLLAARAVEVARLHEERKELEAAKKIQRTLLPSARPVLAGLEFFDYYAPAQQVSGDYYDYLPLPGNRLAVVIGDVAGKGLSAALLMAHLAAGARVCLPGSQTLADAVRQLNLLLLNSIGDDRFITLVAALIDLQNFRLTVINAGHPAPLLRHAGGEQVRVEQPGGDLAGLPLGVRDCPYQQTEVTLEPGDTLLFYTDGVSERRNPAGAFYGVDRLLTAVGNAPAGAASVGQAVLADLEKFAQSRPAGDDLSILCLGRVI